MKIALQALASSVIGLGVLGLLLFVPAGTVNYMQAWVFIGVSTAATLVPSIYLAVNDPAALRRRMHAGPTAESRPLQKVVIFAAFALLVGVMVFSALDHRFGWSPVPTAVTIAGNVLVAAGLAIAQLVVIQNSYAAATITVESGQTLTSTGLYGLVRHPMYVGTLLMMAGIPLVLDSYLGLIVVVPGIAILALRILDEEKLLSQELAGYREYMQRVHYRLVPYVW